MRFLRNLTDDTRAATAVEFGFIALLIALAAIGAMQTQWPAH